MHILIDAVKIENMKDTGKKIFNNFLTKGLHLRYPSFDQKTVDYVVSSPKKLCMNVLLDQLHEQVTLQEQREPMLQFIIKFASISACK